MKRYCDKSTLKHNIAATYLNDFFERLSVGIRFSLKQKIITLDVVRFKEDVNVY